MADSLAERLASITGRALGHEVEIRGLERLTGGASRETWAFDAVGADGARPLILRRDPPGDIREAGIAREAAVLTAAARTGVPVPAVLASDPDGSELGSPSIVMERVEGETLAPRILRDDAYAAVRPSLAGSCGEILARIHAIPVGDVPGLEHQDPLDLLETMLDSFAERSPALELGLRWLAANRAEPPIAAVVHGDFRNGNLVVGPDGINAVLDWELTHLGDPLEDLGWLCVRAWRFGAAPPVGGFGPVEDLIAGYERAGGRPVDAQAVRWWQVWGTVRWGLGCMEMASWHLSGERRSVELAAIGRRVREQEYDVLTLLGAA
jgi:aminoglycoside phosphotransferase (APT) family kinase protein